MSKCDSKLNSKFDYFIGIDTGRYSNVAVMIDSQGNKMQSLRFSYVMLKSKIEYEPIGHTQSKVQSSF
jgi:hypothetical protein